MKKLLLLLFCLPLLSMAQLTTIFDANFEQALITLGYDVLPIDGTIPTANINTLTSLDVSNSNISDMTGIADFTALTSLDCSHNTIYLNLLDVSSNANLEYLDCSYNNLNFLVVSSNTALTYLDCSWNQLTALDVSANTALTHLDCFGGAAMPNQITTLDVSANTTLTYLNCGRNLLTTLDVSVNTALTYLNCSDNLITSLDVSNNTNLTNLQCSNNQLSYLDIRNGNNHNMNAFPSSFDVRNNPNLFCIAVDDTVWAAANWTVANGSIDPQHTFNTNCTPSWDCVVGACIDYNLGTGGYATLSDCQATCGINAIEEVEDTKELVRVVDILGKEAIIKQKGILFYLYSDGTVEKVVQVE
jgi:hypothetical protein